jgi:hypothetical protein
VPARLGQVAALASPNGIAQDEEGDDGQRRYPVDTNAEGEGGIERPEAQRHDEGRNLVVEGAQVGGQRPPRK